MNDFISAYAIGAPEALAAVGSSTRDGGQRWMIPIHSYLNGKHPMTRIIWLRTKSIQEDSHRLGLESRLEKQNHSPSELFADSRAQLSAQSCQWIEKNFAEDITLCHLADQAAERGELLVTNGQGIPLQWGCTQFLNVSRSPPDEST